MEPVSGAFGRRILLTPTPSADNISDMLPDTNPDVTDTTRVAHSPDPFLQRKDVPDCHSEASQLLTPCPLTAVYAPAPSPAPCTVTLDDPVTALFEYRLPLILSAA
jgi:hypothetical protein